jgi:hypothetical protein
MSSLKNGRYRIEGVLGSGSQGETLDAVDTSSEKRVAIKRFFVRGAASWKDVELAEREARVLSGIEHPRLPRYLDHFEEAGALCLVMDRVEGESLAALRKRGGVLGRNEVVRLLSDVGELLDYLHGRNPPIIHRDIKPGNVIRKPDGSFALVDFGSVRDSLKPEGGSTVVGTFGFMAPEQFQGRALGQSDVYGLGATALTLLSGREPEDLPHKGLAIDVLAALPHDPTFARVLSKMLDPDPDRRATHVAPLVGELTWKPGAPAGATPSGTPAGATPYGAVYEAAYRTAHDAASRAAAEAEAAGAAAAKAAREAARKYEHVHEYGSGRVWGPGARTRPLVPNAIMIALFVVGLLLARFSTGLLFRVFLPILLTLLSIFFGAGLRRAAGRMRDVGERGDKGLRHAMDVVRGRARAPTEEQTPGRHIRVEEFEHPEDETFAQEEPGDTRRSRRR